MKKVLFFAPYGRWILHHQVDGVIASSLKLRGAEVLTVLCGGVFKDCPLAKDYSDKEAFCRDCLLSGKNFFEFFQVPVITLDSILQKEDYKRCHQWVESLNKGDLLNAEFEGKNLGDFVHSGVCSYFLVSKPDLSDKKVAKVYKNFLYDAALLKLSYDKLIKDFQPDHIVCFHAKLIFYRVIFELARLDNIPVLVHERGVIDDCFMFLANGNTGMSAGRLKSWAEWKKIPLSYEECKQIKTLLKEREEGKNQSIPGFYDINQKRNYNLRQSLRLPKNATIIVVFTASDWELGMDRELCVNFTSAIDAMQDIVKSFSKWPDVYIIFRHHPNIMSNKHTDSVFLKNLFELNRKIPQNVRVIMPKESITSYELMWFADASISFGSTTGIEAISKGLPTASNVDNIYNLIDFGLERILTPDSYLSSLKKAISKKQNNELNSLKNVYRAFYFYFITLSYKFKSFGIKNHFYYDVRINDINELLEGNDPTLDKVCNYLLKGASLFPVPGELEKSRSKTEETEFLKRELATIYKKREAVKNKNTLNNFKEPLITVFRMRLDGIAIDEKPGPIDTVFYETVKKSRQKNIEFNDIAAPYYYNLTNFLNELINSINMAKGEYIYLGQDFIHIDESLFSSAVDFLEEPENKKYDGTINGLWICDNHGKIINDLFTERNDTNSFSKTLSIFPLFEDPKYFLTIFVWRKDSLQKILKSIEKIESFQELSEYIFKQTISKNAKLKFFKTLIPNVTMYIPPTSMNIESDGVKLLNEKKWQEALALFQKAKTMGKKVPDLNYYRAVALFQMGKYWRSRLALDIQLSEKPDDQKSLDLLSNISLKLENKKISYQDIVSCVESVDRHLSNGQEEFLFNKAASLKDNAVIVEIGSRFGGSTIPLAYACTGTNKKLYAIDPFSSDTVNNDFFDVWYKNVNRFDLENYVIPCKGYSSEKLIELEKKNTKIDFVFIDASHLYKDTLEEFERVYPLVKNGGYIAFHDVDWPGPLRVWLERAMHILSSHEYCGNLACGRKNAQIVLKKSPPLNAPFNYAKYMADYSTNHELSQAMKVSLGLNDSYSIEHSEQIIGTMPNYTKEYLRTLITLLNKEIENYGQPEFHIDPYLLFWNALTLEQEENISETITYLEQAIKFSANHHIQERIMFHLNRLKNTEKENVSLQNKISFKKEYVKIRAGFGSLLNKMKQKKCNISFFGASVTAQKEGYVLYLHKNISDKFNIQHNLFQNGFGGHALETSVALLEKYVTKNKPDICFIEWTTRPVKFKNDNLIYKYLEAIIYKLRQINCEICFLYLGIDDLFEAHKPNVERARPYISFFENIADLHNIPSINLYEYLQDYKNFLEQNNDFDSYDILFRDFVHTSKTGSYFYGELLFKFFMTILNSRTTTYQKNTRFMFPNNEYFFVKYLPIEIHMFLNQSNVKKGLIYTNDFGDCDFYEIDNHNEIHLRINGSRLLNIWALSGINAGIIEIKTSFGTYNHQIWDSYSHYDRVTSGTVQSEIKFVPNEKIIIKLTDIEVDYSECRRKIENTENIVKVLRIIGVSYL